MANITVEGEPRRYLSRRDFLKLGALVTGAAAVGFGMKLLQVETKKNTHYITNFRPGLPPDEGGYGQVNCFNNPDLLPRTQNGEFRLVEHEDGTKTVYQSVNPAENCVTTNHPEGTEYAVFEVYDANPNTPGVPVSQNFKEGKPSPQNNQSDAITRLSGFVRWFLGEGNSK